MTTIVGGLRDRLIEDSVYRTVRNGLDALGWFAAGRRHAAIAVVPEAQDLGTEIPLNTLAVSSENKHSADTEIGSLLAEHTQFFYVDFFAESDALGKHLIGDVRDLLEGRMPSIGRTGPSIAVYDWRLATPPLLFYVDVEGVQVDRAHNYPAPYLRHWFSIQFQTVDYYGTENDA